jgi:YidC/Oxa1 family membrane protein insertase
MRQRPIVRAGFGLALVASFALLVGWPAAASDGLAHASPAAVLAQAEATKDPCPAATPTPIPTPTAIPGQSPIPTVPPNLCPAPGPGSAHFDPLTGLLTWLFTPVFQVIFLGLAAFYSLIGDIGLSIILVTLALRVILVPLFRTQIVSTRRMQMLQPELKALQQRFKGDRARISQEQMRLYRERGVSPTAGCLPAILQLGLLLPMYQVIREGLTAPSIEPMLRVLGTKLISVTCYAPDNPLASCINPTVHWLFNLDAAHPEVIASIPFPLVGTLGLSLLALASALLQLVQTRMVTPQTNDPQQRAQQRTFLFLPLISLLYGGILPAGLFLYWITTTLFSIAQQYLIVGWGSLFPLFGYTPSFAVDHTPRFPVTAAAPSSPGSTPSSPSPTPRGSLPLDRAAGTVRPSKQRGRTSRRGRRR